MVIGMIARWMMVAGGLIFFVGAGLYLADRFGFSLGQLPGDIRIQSGNTSIYFPLATSILISLILTIVINLLAKWWKH